jgi:hypothetical protein
MKAYSLDLREKIVTAHLAEKNFLSNARHPKNHQLKTQGSPGLCAIALEFLLLFTLCALAWRWLKSESSLK